MTIQEFLQNVISTRVEALPSKSDTAVAHYLYNFLHQDDLATQERVPPVWGQGCFWIYFSAQAIWVPVDPKELEALVLRWYGVFCVEEEEPYKAQNAKAVVEKTATLCYGLLQYSKDRAGNEWISDTTKGIAFSDSFLRVVTTEDNRFSLEAQHVTHRERVTNGFDFDAPAIPELSHEIDAASWSQSMIAWLKDNGAPLFGHYLSTVFAEEADQWERLRFLAQWAGIALVGCSSNQRFHRALLLLGTKGTGKSTFIKVLSSLFPKGSLSSVPPHVFPKPDMISGMAGARLNAIEELSKEPIKDDAILRSVIDGARLQVRDPYKQNYFFSPQCAHIFGCNRLPSISGANPATWDRFSVLTLNRKFRHTTNEIHDLDQRIAEKEKQIVVAWALAGALDAFALNGYLIPPSSVVDLAGWSKESDSVGLFVLENLADEQGVITPPDKASSAPALADLFALYRFWCQKDGYSPVGKKEFSLRLADQGVRVVKQKGYVVLASLNDQGVDLECEFASTK